MMTTIATIKTQRVHDGWHSWVDVHDANATDENPRLLMSIEGCTHKDETPNKLTQILLNNCVRRWTGTVQPAPVVINQEAVYQEKVKDLAIWCTSNHTGIGVRAFTNVFSTGILRISQKFNKEQVLVIQDVFKAMKEL